MPRVPCGGDVEDFGVHAFATLLRQTSILIMHNGIEVSRDKREG
jgi:hypothetical protein